MVARLGSAVVSTPVCDCEVSQGDRASTGKDRKQRASEIRAAQEEAGCPRQDYIGLRGASSRPAGRRDDAPAQTWPGLAAANPLGQQQSLKTGPFSHCPPPQCTVHQAISNSPPSPEAPGSSSEVDEGDAFLVGVLPQRPGNNERFSFLGFPAEIRNMIYSHALHWPDCVDTYRSFYRQIPSYPDTDNPHASGYKRSLKTPTILLLCRRITEESLPVLKSRCLVIDRLPPFVPSGLMEITDFIGRRTLQSVHHIDIRIGLGEGPLGSGWIWMRLLDDILAVLSENNAFVKLRLLVRMCNDRLVARWDQERRYNQDISKTSDTRIPTSSPRARSS